jgi:hypothetical protein
MHVKDVKSVVVDKQIKHSLEAVLVEYKAHDSIYCMSGNNVYPIIEFEVDFNVLKTESSVSAVTDPLEILAQKTTFLPSLLGVNVIRHHGEKFVLSGREAVYMAKMLKHYPVKVVSEIRVPYIYRSFGTSLQVSGSSNVDQGLASYTGNTFLLVTASATSSCTWSYFGRASLTVSLNCTLY